MKVLFLLCLTGLGLLPEMKASPNQGVNASSLGLSEAVTAYPGTRYLFGNAANLANIENSALEINCLNLFMVPDLNRCTLSGMLDREKTGMAFSAGYFGFTEYHTWNLALSSGRELRPWLKAGVTVGLQQTHLAETLERITRICGDIGFLIQATPSLSWGLLIRNIPDPLSDPLHISTGLAWLGDDFYLSLQADWEKESGVALANALEYQVGERLAVRAGLRTGPELVYSFGIGFRLAPHTQLDLGFSRHFPLGPSSGISLLYNPTSKNAN